jgi:zinc protease
MGSAFAMVLALGVLGACSSATTDSGPPALLDPGFTRTVLSNGLEVLVLPDHASPILTAMMTVRSGAFVEEVSQAGYSHLLEHMLFKANDLEPDPDGFRHALQRHGILDNAFTGRDRTAYYFVLPTSERDEAMALFAASLRGPRFDETSLQTEIAVVLAEYDRVESDPRNVQLRRARELLYDQYPNRVDALGRRDVIEQATPEALQELYRTYYVPNNACLMLIGDIDADAGIALAKRYFGDWPRAPDPFREHPAPEHPKLKQSAREIVTGDVQESRLIVAFQAPSATRAFRDSIAADLLARITFLSDHVFRTLVDPPTITGARLSHEPSPGKGMLAIELTIGAGHELAALDKLRRLGNFAQPITSEQIETARDQIWSDRVFNAESGLNLCFALSGDWVLGRLETSSDPLATLYEIERADLERVWKDYLIAEPSVKVLLTSYQASTALNDALESAW